MASTSAVQPVRCQPHRAFSCSRKAPVPTRRQLQDRDASAFKARAGKALAPVSDVTCEIPLRLNQTPHERETRRFFYRDIALNTLRGVDAGLTRFRVRSIIPELNPQMDVYRVGTLLEMAREVATVLAENGKRVKVCVQGSMGDGVFQALPLSLNGVSRIMEAMDWGEVRDFVTLGSVGVDDVDESTDVYILLAPQNIIGGCVLTNLGEMVTAVEAAGKQSVLLNPTLTDVPSASGVMGVRGRADRIAFDKSFDHAYHFRLIYWSGTMYPIVGALRMEYGGPWQVYKRIDLGRGSEQYQLWGEFATEPKGGDMTEVLREKTPLRLRGTFPEDKPKRNSDRWW